MYLDLQSILFIIISIGAVAITIFKKPSPSDTRLGLMFGIGIWLLGLVVCIGISQEADDVLNSLIKLKDFAEHARWMSYVALFLGAMGGLVIGPVVRDLLRKRWN